MPTSRDNQDEKNAPAAPVVLTSERFAADAALGALAAGGAPLAVGAAGAAVKRVQLALEELGFGLGRSGADGRYGAATTAAVTTFQRGAGLPASGALDAATLGALDTRVRAIDHPPSPPLDAGQLDAPRFASDPVFRAIALGGKPMGKGARGLAVEKLQWTLLGLGFELPRYGADGGWGDETQAALSAFQRARKLPESGLLDGPTLLSLDDVVARALDDLRARAMAPEEKALRHQLLVDLLRCRIHVVDKASGRHLACYLTSPGVPEFPTKGERFVLQATYVLAWWRPPPGAAWAARLAPEPPGLDNPMGLCKLHFGAHAQYFHGIPRHEERDLGKPASHGCCRMSGANILEFHQLWAGPGCEVRLLREAKASDELAAAQKAAGVAPRPLTAGREYTAAYLYGELGANEQLGKDGALVTVAGRGGKEA